MNDKFQLLARPTQCGKTWSVMNHIADEVIEDDSIINIMFVDNSLLQSQQLCTRMESFDGIAENSTLVLSSKSKVKSINELPTHILQNGFWNIITCSNGTRAKNIDAFLKSWTIFDPNNNYKFNIYIDESDKFLTLFEPYLKTWAELVHVRTIMMITATPQRIIKDFGEIKITRMEHTYDADKYHRFSDSEFVVYTLQKNENRHYYEKCLNMALENGHINAGDVYYFPGNVKKVSHYSIKNVCLEYGFNVVTINADGCRLYTDSENNTKYISINTSGKEISTILADIYVEKQLNQKPFAISGMTCISRGVTLSSPRMMLSHAILPPKVSNVANIYQSGGRLTNNLKQHPNFRRPVVYCTQSVRTSVCQSETRTCNLAMKAYKFDKDTVTNDDWKLATKKWTIKTHIFDTLEKSIEFLHSNGMAVGRTKENVGVHNIQGYWINVKAKRKHEYVLVQNLKAENRLLRSEFEKINPSHYLTNTRLYVVYPVYENAESKECMFYIRYKTL